MDIQMLKRYWHSQGIALSRGASAKDIADFENLHGVKLPQDIEQYFREVNGFSEASARENDSHGFRFLPLCSIRTAEEVLKTFSPGLPVMPNAGEFFVFADYLQWSWGYAIRLCGTPVRTNEIVHVGSFSCVPIANGFEEFIKLYLNNDRSLYVEG